MGALFSKRLKQSLKPAKQRAQEGYEALGLGLRLFKLFISFPVFVMAVFLGHGLACAGIMIKDNILSPIKIVNAKLAVCINNGQNQIPFIFGLEAV